MSKITIQPPVTLTLLTTFKCTAACDNCCFQCSPKASRMMSIEQIKKYIDTCLERYPTLKVVVFTGGECTLLGESLFEGITHAKTRGLSTRIVTNGCWATSYTAALKFVKKLKYHGLTEINFSTGDEHQAFVPFKHVRDAAIASIRCGLSCAINVETHDETHFDFEQILSKDKFLKALSSTTLEEGKIYIERGIWAPMKKGYHPFTYKKYIEHFKFNRCIHLFNNILINPYGEVLSCCGITSETNPYMRIGNINTQDIGTIYERSVLDFLKVWIFVDGPEKVMSFIKEKRGETNDFVTGHSCQICREIFCNKYNMAIVRKFSHEISSNVIYKYQLIKNNIIT